MGKYQVIFNVGNSQPYKLVIWLIQAIKPDCEWFPHDAYILYGLKWWHSWYWVWRVGYKYNKHNLYLCLWLKNAENQISTYGTAVSTLITTLINLTWLDWIDADCAPSIMTSNPSMFNLVVYMWYWFISQSTTASISRSLQLNMSRCLVYVALDCHYEARMSLSHMTSQIVITPVSCVYNENILTFCCH